HTFCCPSTDGINCLSEQNARTGTTCIGKIDSTDPRVQTNPTLLTEANKICGQWAMKDLDCPSAGCYGFSFTLNGYTGDDAYHQPTPVPFPQSNTDPKNPQGAPDWTTTFANTTTSPDNKGGRASAPIIRCRTAPPAPSRSRGRALATDH